MSELDEINLRADKLQAANSVLRQELESATVELKNINEMLAARRKTIAALTEENAVLTAQSTDVELAVAKKVVELGINLKAVTQPKPGAAVMPTGPAAGGAGQPGAQSGAAKAQVNYTELCQAHIEQHGSTNITTEKPA